MRGCFLIDTQAVRVLEAFPAYAGMFLSVVASSTKCGSFPRVCGDVSGPLDVLLKLSQLSPRMRGCFLIHNAVSVESSAFPAYAGMFLYLTTIWFVAVSFPRVCGDVSRPGLKVGKSNRLSPRMRGCFHAVSLLSFGALAFPAYAGMFP